MRTGQLKGLRCKYTVQVSNRLLWAFRSVKGVKVYVQTSRGVIVDV